VFDRFTEEAKQTLVRGNTAVRRLRHAYVGTEHLLLGLVDATSGNAIQILAALDVSPAVLAGRVEEIAPRGTTEPDAHIPFTPRAKKVLELAVRQADDLGDAHIGTEHLLIAMLEEGEGVAARVLADAGVRREDVLRALPAAPRVDAMGREPANPGVSS
jgi:ATP-dependent Clp protease ATP-binding subunit ClpC